MNKNFSGIHKRNLVGIVLDKNAEKFAEIFSIGNYEQSLGIVYAKFPDLVLKTYKFNPLDEKNEIKLFYRLNDDRGEKLDKINLGPETFAKTYFELSKIKSGKIRYGKFMEDYLKLFSQEFRL